MADSTIVGPLTWAVTMEWGRNLDRYCASGLPYIPVDWNAIFERIDRVREPLNPAAHGVSMVVPALSVSTSSSSSEMVAPRAPLQSNDMVDATWWQRLFQVITPSSPTASTPDHPLQNPVVIVTEKDAPFDPTLERSHTNSRTATTTRTIIGQRHDELCDMLVAMHLFVECMTQCASMKKRVRFQVPLESPGAHNASVLPPTSTGPAHTLNDPHVRTAFYFLLGDMHTNTAWHIRNAARCTHARIIESIRALVSRAEIPDAVIHTYVRLHECTVDSVHPVGVYPHYRTSAFQEFSKTLVACQSMDTRRVLVGRFWTMLAEHCEKLDAPASIPARVVQPATAAPKFFANNHNTMARVPWHQLRARWAHLSRDDCTLIDAAMLASRIHLSDTHPTTTTTTPLQSHPPHVAAYDLESWECLVHDLAHHDYNAIHEIYHPHTSTSSDHTRPRTLPIPFIPLAPTTLHECMVQLWNALRGCLWCAYCRAHHRLHYRKCPPNSTWFDGQYANPTVDDSSPSNSPPSTAFHVTHMRPFPPTFQDLVGHAHVLRQDPTEHADPYLRNLVSDPRVHAHGGKTGSGLDLMGYGGTWCQWLYFKKQEVTSYAHSRQSETTRHVMATDLKMDKFIRRQWLYTEYASVHDVWDLIIVLTFNLPAISTPAATTTLSPPSTYDAMERDSEHDAWHTNVKIHDILQKTQNLDDVILECSAVKRGAWILALQCITALAAYTPGHESIVGYCSPPQPHANHVHNYWNPERLGLWMLCQQWQWAYDQDGGDVYYTHPSHHDTASFTHHKRMRVGEHVSRLLSKTQPFFVDIWSALAQQGGITRTPPTAYLLAATTLYKSCFAH